MSSHQMGHTPTPPLKVAYDTVSVLPFNAANHSVMSSGAAMRHVGSGQPMQSKRLAAADNVDWGTEGVLNVKAPRPPIARPTAAAAVGGPYSTIAPSMRSLADTQEPSAAMAFATPDDLPDLPPRVALHQIREGLIRKEIVVAEESDRHWLQDHELARRLILGGIGPLVRFLRVYVVWPYRARTELYLRQKAKVAQLEAQSRTDIGRQQSYEWLEAIVKEFLPDEEALFRKNFYRTALLSLYAFARVQIGGMMAIAYDELFFYPIEECAGRWAALFPSYGPQVAEAEETKAELPKEHSAADRSSVDEATVKEGEGYYAFSDETQTWYWYQDGQYFEVEAPPQTEEVLKGEEEQEDTEGSNASTVSDFGATKAFAQTQKGMLLPRQLSVESINRDVTAPGEDKDGESLVITPTVSHRAPGSEGSTSKHVGFSLITSMSGANQYGTSISTSFLPFSFQPMTDPNDPLTIALKRQEELRNPIIEEAPIRFELIPTAIADTSYSSWELNGHEQADRKRVEVEWLRGWLAGQRRSELTTECLWRQLKVRADLEAEQDEARRLFWIKYRRSTAIKRMLELAYEERHRRSVIFSLEMAPRADITMVLWPSVGALPILIQSELTNYRSIVKEEADALKGIRREWREETMQLMPIDDEDEEEEEEQEQPNVPSLDVNEKTDEGIAVVEDTDEVAVEPQRVVADIEEVDEEAGRKPNEDTITDDLPPQEGKSPLIPDEHEGIHGSHSPPLQEESPVGKSMPEVQEDLGMRSSISGSLGTDFAGGFSTSLQSTPQLPSASIVDAPAPPKEDKEEEEAEEKGATVEEVDDILAALDGAGSLSFGVSNFSTKPTNFEEPEPEAEPPLAESPAPNSLSLSMGADLSFTPTGTPSAQNLEDFGNKYGSTAEDVTASTMRPITAAPKETLPVPTIQASPAMSSLDSFIPSTSMSLGSFQ